MMIANYHTHTKRCHHASGEDEDYILKAIEAGIKILGFSDHVMVPNFKEEGIRGDYSLLLDYIYSLRNLREKYKDKIQILIGFEAESWPMYYKYYKSLLKDKLIDYLILGNHTKMDKDKKLYGFCDIQSPSQLYDYRDLVIKGIKTGMYKILAHPDYFMQHIDFDLDCKKISSDIIDCCIKYDIPMELNIGGLRRGIQNINGKERYQYPTDDFFKLVKNRNGKVIIGVDAHCPDDLKDEKNYNYLLDMVKRLDLKLVDELDSIKENK